LLNRILLLLAVPMAMTVLPLHAQTGPQSDRMDWFRSDKFGMFIHWGPYSQLAGEWKGQKIPVGSEAEWIMQRFNIPVREYREAARSLDPVHFDAAAWVKLAKQTGMKYLVVTAKHHDGFAMYRSKVSGYNIADWTPFDRDPLAELAQECQKAGIRFCVYYSHREDWDDPDGYGNTWDYDRNKKDFKRYLEQKSKPQLRELLSNYGPVGLVWFDRGLETPEQAKDFVDLVHSLQPNCLINGRVGNYGQDLMGDYQNMNDNGMPSGGLDEYWETPQTLNTTWGFSKFDQQWKTPGGVIHRLVEIVSKGGNYLLNIGPTGDGTIPAPSLAVLHDVGTWMSKNGESIYGTSACPLELPWGRCTAKDNKIYLHVFTWPADGVLRVSGLLNEVKAAYPLGSGNQKLKVARENGVPAITLPGGPHDENDTVVVAEIEGRPHVAPAVITQGSDTAFELDYMAALTTGKAARRFNRGGKFHIARWTSPDDSASWHLLISQTGTYDVRINYAARPSSAGAKYVVTVAGHSLTGEVKPTGEWYEYRTFDLGKIKVEEAGEYVVTVRPAAASDRNLMYFQSLILQPAGIPLMVE
jgi:alpha-L-fucosidase